MDLETYPTSTCHEGLINPDLELCVGGRLKRATTGFYVQDKKKDFIFEGRKGGTPFDFIGYKVNENKTDVINDPLGQTHILASSEHWFRLKFVLFLKVGTYGRTNERHVPKTMITTGMTVGRPCGSIGITSGCDCV